MLECGRSFFKFTEMSQLILVGDFMYFPSQSLVCAVKLSSSSLKLMFFKDTEGSRAN